MSDSNKKTNSSKNQKQQPDTLSDNNAKEEQGQLESRRKALKNIIIGGGAVAGANFLPDKWVQPIVNAVVVPAHAATSPIPTTPPQPTTTTSEPTTTTTTTATSSSTDIAWVGTWKLVSEVADTPAGEVTNPGKGTLVILNEDLTVEEDFGQLELLD